MKSSDQGWVCSFCTYQNADKDHLACAMCSKTRPQGQGGGAPLAAAGGGDGGSQRKLPASSNALLERLVASGKISSAAAHSFLSRNPSSGSGGQWDAEPSVRDLQLEEMRLHQEELYREIQAGSSGGERRGS